MPRNTQSITRAQIAAALLAIGILAGFFRFSGLDYLLPLVTEPDAHVVVQVSTLETASPKPEESKDWPKYPLLVAHATALFSEPAPLPAMDASLAEHLQAASAPVLRVRRTVAWLSLLLIPATWLLARRFTGDRWALLATFLASTSLLAVHFATQARPHGAAAAFPALVVVACLRLARAPTPRNYALLAIIGCLAMGSLQSAVALGFPVIAAHLLSGRGKRHHAQLLIPIAGFAVAIWLFYPFLIDGLRFTTDKDTLELGGHEIYFNTFRGGGLPIVLRTLFGWEPALGLGSIIAIAFALRDRLTRTQRLEQRGNRWILLAYVLPYLLVICLNPRTFERFLLPLIPFLATWTAWGLARLSRSGPKALAQLATLLICVTPIVVGTKLTLLRHRPTTLDLAAAWLTESEADPANPVHIFRPNVLPLFKTDESDLHDEEDQPLQGRRQLNWSSYQRDRLTNQANNESWNLRFCPVSSQEGKLEQMQRDPRAYLAALGEGETVIFEIYEDHRYLHAFNNLTKAIRVLYPMLAEFKPGPPHEIPLNYQDLVRPIPPAFALRVLRADRFGPPLEIFALEPKQP